MLGHFLNNSVFNLSNRCSGYKGTYIFYMKKKPIRLQLLFEKREGESESEFLKFYLSLLMMLTGAFFYPKSNTYKKYCVVFIVSIGYSLLGNFSKIGCKYFSILIIISYLARVLFVCYENGKPLW